MKLILSRKEDNMFRTLLRLSREAVRYRMLYFVAVLSTLALTVVNLAAPKILSAMTGIVETGVSVSGLHRIGIFTVIFGAYGLYNALRGGLKHDVGWWRNAGRAFARGASSGLMISLFMFVIYSCSFGFGMR